MSNSKSYQNLRLGRPVNKPFVSNRPVQSRPRFPNRSETSLKENISRDGYFDRDSCYIDSRYSECYYHKSVKSSASVKGCKLPEYYNSPTSFSSPFRMPRINGKSTSFNSFIRNCETYISKRIDPTLRIHYLISACVGEPAESIEHSVLLDPEQGYTEALRILETLYGSPGRISDVSVVRQTKGLPSRRKTITSSLPLPPPPTQIRNG